MGRAISDGCSDAYIQDVVVYSEFRGQGIGGSDGAEVIGIVDDGWKEVDCGDDSLLLVELVDRGVVGRGEANQEVGEVGRPKGRAYRSKDSLQLRWGQLRRSTGAGGESGQSDWFLSHDVYQTTRSILPPDDSAIDVDPSHGGSYNGRI